LFLTYKLRFYYSVRQCKNKWKLIDTSISSKPKNYTLSKKLITLANKLDIKSHEKFISIESNILFKCAMIAYQVMSKLENMYLLTFYVQIIWFQ